MINQHPGGERPAAGLVMEQIGKRFASVTALNAVTLRLNPGEIHGLIGENGAAEISSSSVAISSSNVKRLLPAKMIFLLFSSMSPSSMR